MDGNKQVGGRDEKAEKNQNQIEAGGEGGSKGKSCKGYLYYSSTLKSNDTNPRCIGIPRTLQQVPNYIVGQSEDKASKEGRTLTDFYYGCIGYSVYVSKDHSTDKQKQAAKTQLPVCVGLELLVDRRVVTSDNASAPAHVHGREDGLEIHQPQTPKPVHAAGDDFLSRYTRNANLVASGVAKNMRRMGNYIKENLDDILYPYRRRPK
ncbi:hypothetical protein P3X46_029212 [Hevea brasiliensis]|uniref:DUF8204 domain-containing protein n=1 Tax=Hevea brasiliensis TaxID=3981 RepID=A0ABQ9KUL2_HEVBR|nr:uncharacterized protein LOC110651224 [Hevea brasiliensis]KAJ9147003.1 hypothetical protein P3X46_029212 [Hevea brasiliensis]